MKLRRCIALGLGLLATLIVSGCAGASAPPADNTTVAVDTPFELGAGKTATLSPGNVKITFINVTEDSRCPTGVQCAWAGQTIVQIKVDPSGGGPGTASLTLGGAKSGMDTAGFGPYRVQLQGLAPQPNANVATNQSDYIVTLLVTER